MPFALPFLSNRTTPVRQSVERPEAGTYAELYTRNLPSQRSALPHTELDVLLDEIRTELREGMEEASFSAMCGVLFDRMGRLPSMGPVSIRPMDLKNIRAVDSVPLVETRAWRTFLGMRRLLTAKTGEGGSVVASEGGVAAEEGVAEQVEVLAEQRLHEDPQERASSLNPSATGISPSSTSTDPYDSVPSGPAPPPSPSSKRSYSTIDKSEVSRTEALCGIHKVDHAMIVKGPPLPLAASLSLSEADAEAPEVLSTPTALVSASLQQPRVRLSDPPPESASRIGRLTRKLSSLHSYRPGPSRPPSAQEPPAKVQISPTPAPAPAHGPPTCVPAFTAELKTFTGPLDFLLADVAEGRRGARGPVMEKIRMGMGQGIMYLVQAFESCGTWQGMVLVHTSLTRMIVLDGDAKVLAMESCQPQAHSDPIPLAKFFSSPQQFQDCLRWDLETDLPSYRDALVSFVDAAYDVVGCISRLEPLRRLRHPVPGPDSLWCKISRGFGQKRDIQMAIAAARPNMKSSVEADRGLAARPSMEESNETDELGRGKRKKLRVANKKPPRSPPRPPPPPPPPPPGGDDDEDDDDDGDDNGRGPPEPGPGARERRGLAGRAHIGASNAPPTTHQLDSSPPPSLAHDLSASDASDQLISPNSDAFPHLDKHSSLPPLDRLYAFPPLDVYESLDTSSTFGFEDELELERLKELEARAALLALGKEGWRVKFVSGEEMEVLLKEGVAAATSKRTVEHR